MSDTITQQPEQSNQTAPSELQKPSEQRPLPPPKKKKSKTAKVIIKTVITVMIVAVVGFLLWWGIKKVFFTEQTTYTKTGQASIRDRLAVKVDGYGFTKPVESVSVNVPTAGTILESLVMEGAVVAEGDLLCVIDGADLDKAIETLNQEREAIVKQIENTTKDMNEANKEQNAQQNESVVTAPFSGKLVDAQKLMIGDMVSRGDKIGLLVDDSSMIIHQYFSYGYINDIAVGQKADVSIPAAMCLLEGTVTNVEQVKNIQTDGTVSFEVEIKIANPGALTKDMPATATLKKNGEDILPAGDSVLEYVREQVVSVGASGLVKNFNARNFYEYKSGDVFLEIDFKKDDSAIEGYLTALETYNIQLDEKDRLIAEKNEMYASLEIKAPTSGTIIFASAVAGSKVEAGATVCNIADMSQMIIEAQVDQQNIGSFSVGMPVELTYWSDAGEQMLTGTVKSISLEGKNEGGYVYFPCTLSVDNSSNTLKSGFGVNYSAVVGESFNCVVVPINAIQATELGECVFIQSEERPENAIDLADGIVPKGFYAVPVVCGLSDFEVIEVISGVTDGQVVFTEKSTIQPSPDAEGGDMGGGDINVKPMPAG